MKINLDQKIKLMEPIIVTEGTTEIRRDYFNDGLDGDLTLAQVAARALSNAPPPKGKELAADEKLYRYKLALELFEGGTQDISVDDLKLVKDAVNAAYSNIAIVAQAHMMLEGDD
jgi:hypothetical protein